MTTLHEAVEEYLCREMPAGTVIGNPKWWAPKIARVMRAALAQQVGPDDYKSWYEEAMVASNEAGFVGLSAAKTIRELSLMLAPAPQPVVKTPPEWWPAVENILLEYGIDAISFVADFKKASSVYPAQIKQDISAPQAQQGEPVAWAISYDGKTPYALWTDGDGPLLDLEVKRQGGTCCKLPLYAAPAPQAQQPLTEWISVKDALPPKKRGASYMQHSTGVVLVKHSDRPDYPITAHAIVGEGLGVGIAIPTEGAAEYPEIAWYSVGRNLQNPFDLKNQDFDRYLPKIFGSKITHWMPIPEGHGIGEKQ